MIDIAAPIADVFAFVSDPRNDPAWCPKVESVTAQGNGPAPGADYLVVHRPVPLRPARAMRYRLVDWDPPKAISWREDDGHDRIAVGYHLQALGADSTRFTQTDDARARRPMPPAPARARRHPARHHPPARAAARSPAATLSAAARTAASSASTDGRVASAARVAAKIVRWTSPSAIARTSHAGLQASGCTSRGSSVTAWPLGDERQADDAVVGAVADVGVEAAELAAGARPSSPPRPCRRWPAVQAAPAQRGQRRRPSGCAARERVGRRQDRRARVEAQVVALDARPAAGAAGAATRRPARGRRRRGRAPAATARARPRRARSAGRGASRASVCMAGIASRSADRLERRDPPAPGHACRPPRRAPPRPARPARAARRRAATSTSAASVSRTPRPARSSSGTPASRSSTASCCETADGVNCSASATAAIVPRSCSSCSRRSRRRSSIAKQRYRIPVSNRELFLNCRASTIAPCVRSAPCSASPPRAAFGAMGIFGKLAYDDGRDRRHAAGHALPAGGGAVLGAGRSRPAASRRLRALLAPRRRARARRSARSATAPRPAPTSRRCAASTPRCSRCSLYTYPAMVTVARDRARARARPTRRTTAALALASLGLVLVLALPGRPAALDPLGTALGDDRGGRLHHLHPGLGGRRRARRPARAQRARLHRRGGDADRRPAWRRRPRTWARQRRRLRLARVPSPSISTVGAIGAVLRRHPARRPHRGVDPLDDEPVVTVAARVPRLRRVAGRRSSCWAGRSCSARAVVLTASARRSPQQNTATLNGRSVGVPAEL